MKVATTLVHLFASVGLIFSSTALCTEHIKLEPNAKDMTPVFQKAIEAGSVPIFISCELLHQLKQIEVVAINSKQQQ